jgi:hypothetical protein
MLKKKIKTPTPYSWDVQSTHDLIYIQYFQILINAIQGHLQHIFVKY